MIWKWKWWCFVRLPFYHLAVLRLFVRRCLLIVTRTQISSPDDNWQWKLNLLRPTSQERLSFYLSILCSLRLCFTLQIRSKNPLQINNINKISFFFSIIPSDGRIRSVCSSQSSSQDRTLHFLWHLLLIRVELRGQIVRGEDLQLSCDRQMLILSCSFGRGQGTGFAPWLWGSHWPPSHSTITNWIVFPVKYVRNILESLAIWKIFLILEENGTGISNDNQSGIESLIKSNKKVSRFLS